MDDSQRIAELERIKCTLTFRERLDELEKESRRLRFRRLPYAETMEELAGPIARGVMSAETSGLDETDVQWLWLAVRNELIHQTRDAH